MIEVTKVVNEDKVAAAQTAILRLGPVEQQLVLNALTDEESTHEMPVEVEVTLEVLNPAELDELVYWLEDGEE